MFRQIFLAAVVAALCAGLVTSAFQQLRLVPLILVAETYEGDDHHAETAIEGEEQAAHAHAADEWMPADGFERTAYTVLANLLLAAGFAFVMSAVSLIFNLPITPQTGLFWGVGGFIVFSLAPALGLPPVLPGMNVAETGPRQVWWVLTSGVTLCALVLLSKVRAIWALAIAFGLIVVPHVIGAPQPPLDHSHVPAELASAFAATALANGFLFWLTLGVAYGLLNSVFERKFQ